MSDLMLSSSSPVPERDCSMQAYSTIYRPQWRDQPFAFGELIGSGDYGSVYRARWGDQPCAAKTFFLRASELRQADLEQEQASMQQLRHQNIIRFHGAYEQGDNVYFVMDLAEKGNLAEAIQRRELTCWSTKTRIAHEIARGLEYLHQEGVLHRDLKSTTVLLTQTMEVKLCDYGFPKVKAASVSKANTASKASRRWMAPEIIDADPQFSSKSDVYALAMVMWEMAADCTMPFKHLENDEMVAKKAINGEQEVLPDQTPVMFRAWVERCWKHDPKERPEASEIVLCEIDDSQRSSTDSSLPDVNEHDYIPDKGDEAETGTQETLEPPSPGVEHGKNGIVVKEDVGPNKVPDEIAILVEKADDNYAEAQMALAAKYERGDGVIKSDSTAFFWYQRAARQGQAEAQVLVADLLIHGRGTPQSFTEAVMWYRKAAKQGNAEGQNRLGTMYQKGIGVQQSNAEAAAWYQKAAQQGDSVGQFNLGQMYEEGKRGIPKDSRRAIELYRQAAAQGNAQAEARLVALQQKPKMTKFFRRWIKQ